MATPNLGLLKATYGESGALDVLKIFIIEAVLFFNVGKTMNKEQVSLTAEFVIDEFPEITIADLKLCFNKAYTGEYGEMYDRIDGPVIISWIRKYCDNKMSFFINKRENNHAKFKDVTNVARSEQAEKLGKRIEDIKKVTERYNTQKLIDKSISDHQKQK